MDATLPRLLCVDDEPNVLDGLARQLRRQFAITTATSGRAGLELIATADPFAVVVSDMRMPGMDGAAFLRRVREVAPDTTRVLLTGQADLDAAIAAVNEACIFRFLTKPCPPELLSSSLLAAAEQYRLVTAERVLLEETLHGSVRTLTDVLALASPIAFGRATRAKQLVSQLAERLDLLGRWELEVGAMLSQIGCVTLPVELADKLYHGRALAPPEQEMADRLPAAAEQLLGNIPRLDGVRKIVRYQQQRYDGSGVPRDGVRGDRIPEGARLLKLALDLDVLQAQGLSVGAALDTLRGRAGWYDPAMLRALGDLLGEGRGAEVREMRLREVRPGMTFAEDVTTRAGVLLIPRGHEVTPGLLERIRNFSDHIGVREPVRMIVGRDGHDEAQRAAGR